MRTEKKSRNQCWRHVLLIGCLALAVCHMSRGASDEDPLGGEKGRYNASEAAPDSLTTTDGDATLIVEDGKATADRVFDQGKVKLSSKTGGTAVFSGRSTGWGCTYNVWGTYEGEGEGEGTEKKKTWENEFLEKENDPRIVLEVNEGGAGDDVVLIGDNGGTLYIRVLGTEGEISVTLSVDEENKLDELESPVNVTAGQDTPEEVTLNGRESGEVTITASASINENSISDSITVKVINFRGKIVPEDNFDGRSHQKLGICETGKLEMEGTVPPGGLTWSVPDDSTVLTLTEVTENGTADFKAADKPGTVVLTLKDTHGNAIEYSIDIMYPSDGYCVRTSDSVFKKQADMFSIGIKTKFFVLPMDVSFWGLYFKEGACKGVATGWFKDKAGMDGEVHQAWPDPNPETQGWFTSGNINTGCEAVVWDDRAEGGLDNTPLPYADGTFVWMIPWLISIEGSAPWVEFAKIEQKFTVDANGNATVTKGGCEPGSNNHTDQAQGY